MTVTGNPKDDEGIDFAAASYVCSRAVDFASSRRASTSRISTSTCRKGRPRRTAHRPAPVLATAIVLDWRPASLFVRTAMTGEITLRGRVLPIGGLKEKLSPRCAVASSKTVLIPEETPRTHGDPGQCSEQYGDHPCVPHGRGDRHVLWSADRRRSSGMAR